MQSRSSGEGKRPLEGLDARQPGTAAQESRDIKLDAGDVTVRAIKGPDCEECGKRATHEVRVDFRSAGISLAVVQACSPCAENIAYRIKSSLPKEGSQ